MTQNRSGLDIGVWLLARKSTWNDFPVGAEFGNFAACLTIWNSAHAGHPSLSCQWLWMGPDLFFNHQQKYSKSLVLLAARGSHGPQQFSGWKYPPPHRGLAMVNVKRAICLALFWDLFTNFHKQFILTHVLFPFWQVLQIESEIITMPHSNFYAAHVVCSRFFAYYVNFANWVIFSRFWWNGYKSLTYHLGSWLLTAANTST